MEQEENEPEDNETDWLQIIDEEAERREKKESEEKGDAKKKGFLLVYSLIH